MAGMGPPPKPASQRRRTNATPATTQLPAEGRKGESPEWPLSTHAGYDSNLWDELWSTPQAVIWERLGPGCVRVVARYVVLLAEADVGEPKAAMEVRQIEDRLGLTPLAMLRLRWEIAPDAAEAEGFAPRRRIASTAASTATTSRRDRVLRAIDGGLAG